MRHNASITGIKFECYMVNREDEEETKKDPAISEELLGEVLDEDADEDLVSGALLDDEKAWE